jgi:hypothetical protein
MLNPATVSFDRGLGIEAMYQSGNPLSLSLASGTGKLGGALISSNLENSFFSNRTYELSDDYLERNLKKKQFKTQKLNLALAGKLFRKKNFSLDLGVILKRHGEIKKINPGVGASGRLGPFSFGAALYRDDFYLDLPDGSSYSENFTVTTYSLGTKIKQFSFDAGVIKTKYDLEEMDTEIVIYSGSYIFKNFMFNLAHRTENSPAPKFIGDKLEDKKIKSDFFTGVQTSLGKHLIVGVNYNYYLLSEISFLTTLYF